MRGLMKRTLMSQAPSGATTSPCPKECFPLGFPLRKSHLGEEGGVVQQSLHLGAGGRVHRAVEVGQVDEPEQKRACGTTQGPCRSGSTEWQQLIWS